MFSFILHSKIHCIKQSQHMFVVEFIVGLCLNLEKLFCPQLRYLSIYLWEKLFSPKFASKAVAFVEIFEIDQDQNFHHTHSHT